MYEANRKVAMIGPPSVGKTSIVSRLILGQFNDTYIPTIDNLSEYSCMVQGCTFHLKIGDYPGQDKFASIPRPIENGIDGCLLCYSVTSEQSLKEIIGIRDRLMSRIGSCPCVLVANKVDLVDLRYITREMGEETARMWNCPYIECSAKKGDNVHLAFETLIFEMEKDSGLFNKKSKKFCFCC